MVHGYWGLRQPPFASGLGARGFYESSVQEEALARLHYLVDNRKRLGLLIGQAGLGKSLLFEVFAARLRSADHAVARLNLAAVDRHEVPSLLAEQFRISAASNASDAQAWRKLVSFLSEQVYLQRTATILLDDVDQADADTLRVISRLLHIEAAVSGRLTLVLGTRPTALRQLPENILDAAELRIDLEPWTIQDTAGFLHQSLLQAGRDEAAFDDEAVAHLHTAAQGVPRRIAQLAELALLAGAGQRLERVDARTVDDVARELQPLTNEL